MSQPDFTVEYLDPKTLLPNPLNWRTHPDSQREALAYSLQRFGFVQGVIWNETTARLIDGHARVEEAIKKKRATVPVNVVRLSEEDERALLRVFDPIGAMATTDEETLDRLIAEIGDPDLERLLGELESGSGGLLPEADPDAIPEAVETRCKPGDLWRLGEHRLLCGDSTHHEHIDRLMDGAAADICFTSPPYAQQREYGGNLPDWDELMQGVFSLIPAHETTQVLVNLGLVHKENEWQPYWEGWIQWMREAGWRRFGWYVWDQGPGLPGDWNGRLAPSFEFVFHFNQTAERARKNKACKWAGTHSTSTGMRNPDGSMSGWTHKGRATQDRKIADSVFRVTRHKARGIEVQHPAVFPVLLPAEVFEAFSDPGDVAYEPFAGSGTTLIACEQTGRVARCMEIEPPYCDVILARWESCTGRTAELA